MTRDRHGRGLRGPLYPPGLPAAKSRSELFDSLVLEALEPIEARYRGRLGELDIAVDEVPEVPDDGSQPPLDENVLADREIPLARLVPAGVDWRGVQTRARIVVYRRPLLLRAKDSHELADLVHEVLLDQVDHYLGIDSDEA